LELRGHALRPWLDAGAGGLEHLDAGVLVLSLEALARQAGVDGLAQAVFRKRIFAPALSRLQGLCSRPKERSHRGGGDARLHEPVLARQFGLGPGSCEALRQLAILGDSNVAQVDLARLRLRRAQIAVQVVRPGVRMPRTPVAKLIPAWTSRAPGTCAPAGRQRVLATHARVIGHANLGGKALLAPIFIEHDRSQHAERQALLSLQLESIAEDEDGTNVTFRTGPCDGAVWLYVCAAPCMSCMAASCQFAALTERPFRVAFDTWGETLRWVSVQLPEEDLTEEPDPLPGWEEAARAWLPLGDLGEEAAAAGWR